MEHVLKRKGHKEPFDAKKIYATVYASCKSLRMADAEIELIAEMVKHEISDAMAVHKAIETSKLHAHVVKSLKKYHPDAAYLYKHHKDLS